MYESSWSLYFLISVTCLDLYNKSFLFLLHVVVWNLWNDHVLGWWKHKDDPNVLFLKYEDLQKVRCFEASILSCSRISVSGKLVRTSFPPFSSSL